MIQDLIELLDRSWAALDAEKGLDFALQCFPFHEQLLRDSRLNALLIEFRREEADSIAVLRRVEVTTRARLATIADALEAGAPPALEAASDDAPDDVADCVSSIGLVRQLLAPAQANEHGERDGRDAYFDDRVNRAIGCLKNWFPRHEPIRSAFNWMRWSERSDMLRASGRRLSAHPQHLH